MVDEFDVELELAKYRPDGRTAPETAEKTRKFIRQGLTVQQAQYKAIAEYRKLRLSKPHDPGDDKYMRDHFASLEEDKCDCLLDHDELAEDGELCEACQAAYDAR